MQKAFELALGPYKKRENPILKPQKGTFYSEAAFNPTAIEKDGALFFLFRASDRGEQKDPLWAQIGLAKSRDGLHLLAHPKPVISPEYAYEIRGCQDPRLVKIRGTYYLTYNGVDGGYERSEICLASSNDLLYWKKQGPLLGKACFSWNRGKRKSAALVPGKIGGRYVMYFMGEKDPWRASIGIAYSDDLLDWREGKRAPVVSSRRGHFDSGGLEPGPPPLVLKEGILLFYNGWDEEKTHRVGAVLFSKNDPSQVLWRTPKPLLEPTKGWEKKRDWGICFAEGAVLWGGKVYLYYGGGDRYVGLAVLARGRILDPFRKVGYNNRKGGGDDASVGCRDRG